MPPPLYISITFRGFIHNFLWILVGLTFVVETKQVDKRAVGGAEGRVVLLRSQRLEVGQVGGACGRRDGRLHAPLRGGGRGLVVGGHDAASPAGDATTNIVSVRNRSTFS